MPYCSIEKLFFELGWKSLQSRRNKNKLVIFYKILHDLTPNYLSDLVPPTVQEITTYSLQNSGHIQNYRANRNLFLDSFFPSTIRAGNSLPSEVQQASSVAAFKFRLSRDLHTPPKYFNSGTRKGQILQARLKMGCSSLNSDLYRKHIQCSSKSFLSVLLISSSTAQTIMVRLRYLPWNLHIYTVKDLLFGMENLTEQENQSLFHR